MIRQAVLLIRSSGTQSLSMGSKTSSGIFSGPLFRISTTTPVGVWRKNLVLGGVGIKTRRSRKQASPAAKTTVVSNMVSKPR